MPAPVRCGSRTYKPSDPVSRYQSRPGQDFLGNKKQHECSPNSHHKYNSLSPPLHGRKVGRYTSPLSAIRSDNGRGTIGVCEPREPEEFFTGNTADRHPSHDHDGRRKLPGWPRPHDPGPTSLDPAATSDPLSAAKRNSLAKIPPSTAKK